MKGDKSIWFRKMGAKASLLVPTTVDSLMAKQLRRALINTETLGTTIKVVENLDPQL